MAADKRVSDLLGSLERAAALLNELRFPAPSTLAQEVAAYSLNRTANLARALVLLLRNHHVLAAEPICRILYEIAFNVGWVGKDNARAERFRDDGLGRAEAWFDVKRVKEGVAFAPKAERWLRDLFAARNQTDPKYPGPRRRSAEIDLAFERFRVSGMPRSYREYQWLSAAVHADYWHLRFYADRPEVSTVHVAQNAVGATSAILMIAGEVLGVGEDVKEMVVEMRAIITGTFDTRAGPMRVTNRENDRE